MFLFVCIVGSSKWTHFPMLWSVWDAFCLAKRTYCDSDRWTTTKIWFQQATISRINGEKTQTTWIVCVPCPEINGPNAYYVVGSTQTTSKDTLNKSNTYRIDANCAVLDVSLNVTLQVTVLWLCWTNGTASSYMIKLVNLLLVVEISTIDNSNCIGPFPWVFSFSLSLFNPNIIL